MHKDAVTTELAKHGSSFVEKEKEEENLLYASNQKVFTALYWLCKQEIAQRKLKTLLKFFKPLGAKELKQFRKLLNAVLSDLLLTIGNQIKIGLLDNTRKSPFFSILTYEGTDISNIKNLVTFIEYYDHEKGEAHTAFINSTDFLNA